MQLFSTCMIFLLLSVTHLKKKQEKNINERKRKNSFSKLKDWHVCVFSIILVLCAPCWLTWLLTEIQFTSIPSTLSLYVSVFSSQVIKAINNNNNNNSNKWQGKESTESSFKLHASPVCADTVGVCVCDQRQIQFFHFTSAIASTVFHSSINTINPCILVLWLL